MVKLFHVKHLACWNKKIVFWQRPIFIAKCQSLPRQISLFRGHLENRLAKNEKKRINANQCYICRLDIMVDFH